jgi:hypothetical protein
MKRISLILFCLSALTVNAFSTEIAIVFNGETDTNRAAGFFMSMLPARYGVDWEVEVIADPDQVESNRFDALVVLNSGVPAGIDPVIETFVRNYTEKADLILVSLYSGEEFVPEVIPSESSPLGVDEVIAPSQGLGRMPGMAAGRPPGQPGLGQGGGPGMGMGTPQGGSSTPMIIGDSVYQLLADRLE